ncbi:MAG TPA: hypothetical protein VNM47_08285 [Terriglobia bacterium]|nr:hypothetical protein [Terriglobia bacterium]
MVDTPEEGLDNEGVYTELVPVFRRTKESRQIFVITHNANIPVNADAELIACLEPIGTVDREKLNNWVAELKGSGQEVSIDHLLDLLGPRDWDRKVNEYLSKKDWDDHSIAGLVERIVLERRVEGRIRRWRSSGQEPFESSIGALDKKSVKRAVQDIMEGSEFAFQRRREKYGIP